MSNVPLTLSMPSAVNQNDQFTAQIIASGVQNLASAAFTVTYDPVRLEVVTQSEGVLLKQSGSVRFQSFVDKKKGELWVSLSRMNATAGATGSGTLATVTFKAIGKGAAGIGFANTNFSTYDGVPVPVTPFRSAVQVK